MCDSSLLPELQTHIQLPTDTYPPGCDPEVPQTHAKTEHTFLPRAALPPVSCLSSCYHQTWESSLILLPPLSSHISHQSLKTINIDSTLPPGLLTLPSSGCHSSPAPLLYHPSPAPSFLLFRSILHAALRKGVSLKQKSTTYWHLMSCLSLCLECPSDPHFLSPPSLQLSSGIDSSRKPLLTIIPFLSISPPPSQSGDLPLCSPNKTGYFYYWIYSTVL